MGRGTGYAKSSHKWIIVARVDQSLWQSQCINSTWLTFDASSLQYVLLVYLCILVQETLKINHTPSSRLSSLVEVIQEYVLGEP